MTPSSAIVWYRRDLRRHDHPPLVAALEAHDRVVPLFVVDPRLIRGRFASPNRTWFTLGSVSSLREDLRALGSDLVIRAGDPRAVVPGLAREVGATTVVVARDHAPYGRSRDAVVAAALEADGTRWRTEPGLLAHEPDAIMSGAGGPYSVFTPFRRAWEALPRRMPLPAPGDVGPAPALEPGALPTLPSLGLGDAPTASAAALPEPGETAARGRLERWLATGLDGYADARDRLDRDGTSRLSADLHIGTLSALEVVERASTHAGAGGDAFVRELIWREFYAHVLFHRPDLLGQAFRPEFDRLAWSSDDAGLAAWRDGRTGYPVVDAGMRQLATTGWMHNRARMIVASFLTKDLAIDWRRGEALFMRHLVDGDVASNNGGWQWSASTGTDAQPWFRIFNPVLQGRRHDPDGTFVRRWIPELAGVSTARIHAPWEMSPAEQRSAGCRIGVDYPAPIVDHRAARASALARYEEARRTS
jgi:deoxyribodipyrimidine photo-lyase